MSGLTHPIVWFVFPRVPFGSYDHMVVGAETFAIVVEGALLTWAGLRLGFLWSLFGNLLSVSLGLWCRSIWGWP